MSKKCKFSSEEYDDFFDSVKPILDKVKNNFYKNIIHYIDMNLTPAKNMRNKKKHEKILNQYKEIVDTMKSPIIEMLLNLQHGIYDAIGETFVPKIKFTDEEIIRYKGKLNSYYFPGDIIKFTTTDVKVLDVNKIPFLWKRKRNNLPLRQRDITTKESFLILEIYHTELGCDAKLLLQDEKGYLLAIDYPENCADDENQILEITGSVLSDDEYEDTQTSRDEAYEIACEELEEMEEAREREKEKRIQMEEKLAGIKLPTKKSK